MAWPWHRNCDPRGSNFRLGLGERARWPHARRDQEPRRDQGRRRYVARLLRSQQGRPLEGFFVDFGRALAITVFNDQDKVEFTSSSPQQRLPALQSGEFDILLSGVTETITRSFKLGFNFGPVVFYDGQGILVNKSLGVTKGSDLDGARIGVQSGTTGELNIADFFRKNGKTFTPGDDRGQQRVPAGARIRQVDALTQDASDLALRRTLLKKPDDYVLLPERLSKEPLAPAIRGGDDRWLQIVNWTVYATIQPRSSASPRTISTAS